MERDFKGIWIPKEIWLSTDLTLQEKVFLVEISSLNNEEGCFAGNAYFSEFFGVSKTRVSIIINSLVKKGYITSDIIYKDGTKQILKRVLKETYIGYARKVKDPIQGKFKDNNTFNNTNNKDNSAINKIDNKKKKRDEGYSDDFLEFWKLYNMSINKSKTFTLWKKKNFSEEELKEVMKKVKLYVDNTEKRFRKHPERYVRDSVWNDEVIIKTNVNRYGKPEPKNISTAIKNTQPVDEWEEYNKMKKGSK